jgi:hypothetical protein
MFLSVSTSPSPADNLMYDILMDSMNQDYGITLTLAINKLRKMRDVVESSVYEEVRSRLWDKMMEFHQIN